MTGPHLRYELASSRGLQAHRHGAHNGHRRHDRDLQGALGAGGVVAAMPVEAAADAAVFTAYLDRVLLPKLREAQPDAVLW